MMATPTRPNIPLQPSPSNRMGGGVVHSASRDALRMKRLAEVSKAKHGKV